MNEKRTIKETVEVLASVEIAIDTLSRCFDDGQITASDAFKLVPLIVSLKDGLTGMGEIRAELSDLDNDELTQIVSMVFAIGEKSVALVLKIARA
jgi:hypothetical protein